MANERGLTDQNTEELTPEQLDEAAYKAAYESVKTGETKSSYTVSTVDKDGNEERVEPVKPSVEEKDDEQGSDAKEGDEGEGKQPEQSDTKDGEPSPKFSNADPSTTRKPVEQRDGGEATKPKPQKKPSVFDEARQLHETLDEEARRPLGKIIAHAATQEKLRKELQHRIDSDDGRVRGMQRTIDELRSQLAAAQARPFSAPVSDGKAAQGTAQSVASDNEIKDFISRTPKLKEIYSTDPELASFLAEREVLNAKEKTQQSTQQEVSAEQQFNEQQKLRYVATQAEIIRQRIPNVAEVVKHPWWTNWVDSAPAYIQRMAKSEHAEEVLHVMDMYFRDLEQYKAQSGDPEGATEIDPVQTEKVDKLVEDRNRRAKANAGTPSSVARPTKVEFNAEDEFKKGYASVQTFKR